MFGIDVTVLGEVDGLFYYADCLHVCTDFVDCEKHLTVNSSFVEYRLNCFSLFEELLTCNQENQRFFRLKSTEYTFEI